MGYYYRPFKSIDKICEVIADFIRYHFAKDEETKYFIKRVPHYCRIHCDKIFECRNPNNDWKTYIGYCMYMEPPKDRYYKSKNRK